MSEPFTTLGVSDSGVAAGREAAEADLKKRAGLILTIAVLSLVNTVISYFDGNIRFIFSLGITQVVDELAKQLPSAAIMAGLTIDVIISGAFILLGVMARNGRRWAFVTAAVFYGIDTLIFLLVQDWIGLAVHVYVMYQMFMGLKDIRNLRNWEKAAATPLVTGAAAGQ